MWLLIYIGDSGWFAQAALTVILTAFLMGGSLLTIAGIRDLLRDLWNFLHTHSH